MHAYNLFVRHPRAAFALVCFLLFALTPAFAGSNSVVVSQVYGGGGATSGSPTYKYDYVELHNVGSTAVDLSTWSVQYGSASGTGGWSKANLTGTIAAGQYYLVRGSGGSLGADLPVSFDVSSSLNMSASAGKVALVNNQTALSGACPTGVGIVDVVGYGSANCFEGTAAGGLNSTQGAVRNGSGCTDTDVNSADFTVVTNPVPRNSSSPSVTCGVTSTNPSGNGLANPSTVIQGNMTLLTVVVTPGTLPPSTGIAVTANLSAIGGSASQQFYNDGTNGDVTSGDSTFSFLATVDSSTTVGAKSLAVTITDDQARMGSTSISLTVKAPAQFYPIHDIQGQGDSSPLKGTDVQTSGIVTGVISNGFYLEAPDAQQDGDPATSEGVFVYTGSAPTVAVGDGVQVTGTVAEYGSGSLTSTEITAPSVTVTSHLNSLPTAVDITPLQGDAVDQLERYEGMLVHITNPRVVGPTGSGTSDGVFYVTAGSVPRPFREPGVEPGIALPAGMPPNYPKFDGNFERVKVDTSACATKAVLGVGDVIPDLIGPLNYSSGDFTVYPCPYTATSLVQAVPVPDRGENEFAVASFNMLSFTTDPTRMAKASMAIRNILKMPDIIGVEEMKDLATLQAVAAKVSTDAVAAGQADPQYAAALLGTDGSQNVGFLYRTDRVSLTGPNPVQEFGRVNCGTDPASPLCMPGSTGTPTPINDRPPLVLTAQINLTTGQSLPVTVIANHLRSLIDVDTVSNTGDFARRKRKLGAEYLAGLIAQLQSQGASVISVGDYNAFEFNDGYVDVLGTVIGQPTPADEVLMASADMVDPDLVDLVTTLPADRRYSYVENGNAQTLDHIVVSASLLGRPYHLEIAHNNADFPKTLATDPTRPERVSDHDIPVAYFSLPASGVAGVSPTSMNFTTPILIGQGSSSLFVTVTNTGTADLTMGTPVTSGDFAVSYNFCTATLAAGSSCRIYVRFSPKADGTRTGTLTINDSAADTPQLVTLSGTGVAHVDVSPLSLSFGGVTYGTGSSSQVVSVLNQTGAPITVTPAITGDFAVSYNFCSGTLAPATSCKLYVRFTPTAAGDRTGTLTVNYPGGSTPVTLTGTGLSGGVLLSTTSLSFADQKIGASSSSQVVTVNNKTGVSLTMNTPTIDGSDFVVSYNFCPATLATGTSCQVYVRFAPITAGPHTNTLSINDSAGVQPVTLTGTGVPHVDISPLSLAFGGVTYGTGSSSQFVTVLNQTGAPITVTPAITGDFAVSYNFCTAPLAPATSCKLYVRFTPTTAGVRTGTLTVNYTGGAGAPVTLTGTGLSGGVVLSTATLTFTDLQVGLGSSSQMVTVTNKTGVPLTMGTPLTEGDFIVSYNFCPATLAAGSSCNVFVRFTPTAVGTRTGVLHVVDSDPSSPQNVSLSGNGV